jgi:N-acyl-D-amino-acid deacylase
MGRSIGQGLPLALAFGFLLLTCQGLFAEDSVRTADREREKIANAAARGLALVQKAAANYPKHRDCFSCHHQTLPILAVVTARQHCLPTEEKLLQEQAKFTRDSFLGKIDDLKRGQNVGGRNMTVGYALWALALANEKPDETTEALVAYLLKNQHEKGYWTGQTTRPPLEESYFTCTALAVRGMKRYATTAQQAGVAAAIAKAKACLESALVKGQEDKAARLWALHALDCRPEQLRAAREAVLKSQQPDGGWPQLDTMKSDAYATGQSLFVLQATGFDPAEKAYQRGVRYLLDTQRPDGAWLVVTRSRPIQPYYAFDDEDPLGKNQFISVPATSWAVAALAATQPTNATPNGRGSARSQTSASPSK